MLRKFKVSNFKCFEKEFELDLTDTRGYEFNTECIKNNTVNNAIIYSYNGLGKSNLALAIFDVISHLTDKNKNPEDYKNYLCANSTEEYASFYFEFYLNEKVVIYEYKKTDFYTIAYERLTIDNSEVVLLDRRKGNKADIRLAGAETLNNEIANENLSVVKYIKNNTVLIDNDINKTFNELFYFAENMLFFCSLEKRKFSGFKKDSSTLTDVIIEKNKVEDFEEFLNKAGIECRLGVVDGVDRKSIVFKFENKQLEFFSVISTGTSSLTLFYFWYLHIIEEKVPFLFIDEFDAFYHHELSKFIIDQLKESGVQFILTSHNVSIMTNSILRPDCYFLMNKRTSKSLANCTVKELREAHNIEKMYKAGAFDVE